MSDLEYRNAMNANKTNNGYTLPGLQTELQNKYNNPNFNPINLVGDEARLYNEYGEQYHELSKQENVEIRAKNEQILNDKSYLSKILSFDEIEALYSIPNVETQNEIKNAVIAGDKVAKAKLGSLAKFNKEKKESYDDRTKVQLENNVTLDDLGAYVALANKKNGDTGNVETKMYTAQMMSKHSGNEVIYDSQTDNYAVKDKFGQYHIIEPSTFQAYNWELGAQIAGSLGWAWKASNLAGPIGWAKGAAVYVAGEALANLAPTFADSYLANGKLTLGAMYAADSVMLGAKSLLGMDTEKDKQSMQKIQNMIAFNNSIEYSDRKQRTAEETGLGVAGAIAVPAAFKTISGIYRTPGAVKNRVKGVKDAYQNMGTNLDRANPFNLKDKWKTKVDKIKKSMEQVANDQLQIETHQAVKEFTNDTSLALNNTVAKGREVLKQAGIENVDEMSDFGVHATLTVANKNTAGRFISNMETKLSTDELTYIRDVQATNANNIIESFKVVAKDKMDNSTLGNMITNFRQVRNDSTRVINSIANKYTQEIKLPASVTKLLPQIYKYDGKSITTTLDGKLNYGQLEALNIENKSNRRSLNAAMALSKQNDLGDATLTTSVADALKLRAEIVANKESLKQLGKTSKDIDKLLKNIDDSFKQISIFDQSIGKNNPLWNINFMKDIARINNQMKYIKDFDLLNGIYRNKDSLLTANKSDKTRIIASMTEDMLKNASDLPDLQTFAKMLSSDKASKVEIDNLAKELEDNLVRHIMDKPFGAETRNADIRDILTWIDKNKNNLKSMKAKALAEYANISLRMADQAFDLAQGINTKAKASAKINAGLSTDPTRSLLIRANTWQLQRSAGLLGKFLRSDVAVENYTAKAIANFMAKPLRVSAPKELQNALNQAIKKGNIEPQTAMKLAEEAGEHSALTKKAQDFTEALQRGKISEEQINQLNNLSDVELQRVINGGINGNN